MDKDIILKLVDEYYVQFAGILLENEVVSFIKHPKTNTSKKVSHKLSNLKLNDEYSKKFNVERVADEWIIKFIMLYPKSHKGTFNTIRDKLTRFLTEYPKYSLDDIEGAVRAYLDHQSYTNGNKYLFKQNNLFYKLEGGKHEKSPILEILENYSTDKEKAGAEELEDEDIDV